MISLIWVLILKLESTGRSSFTSQIARPEALSEAEMQNYLVCGARIKVWWVSAEYETIWKIEVRDLLSKALRRGVQSLTGQLGYFY